MSEMIGWIAAEAEPPKSLIGSDALRKEHTAKVDDLIEKLPSHQFGLQRTEGVAAEESGSSLLVEDGFEDDPQDDASYEEDRRRQTYRRRTVGMLRRYMRYSIETGRLPSLVGREFFRSNVTKYQVTTFEDRVIFVHDLERCLQRLDHFSQQVLGRMVLQEYGQEDAARLLGCTRMTVHRTMLEALDELAGILVRVGLLDRLPPSPGKSCQGGKTGPFSVSDCNDGE